jgi:hypothetical protein
MPKFDFYGRARGSQEQPISSPATPIRQSYESIQESAKGPGVDEWREVDKSRAALSQLYRDLADDPRYSEEYKSEQAWRRYEETRARIEQLAPEAREQMLRSAETSERFSIPTPEGEGLLTKDTDKLLLTAHERSRLEGLLARAENSGSGPFRPDPIEKLAEEYERGLKEGGPGGGATCRAIHGLCRDWGLDIDAIVDKHRRPSQRGALEDAEVARMRTRLVGKSVPRPPFPHPEELKRKPGAQKPGTYGSGAKTFVSRESRKIFPNQRRRASWR